MFAVAHRGTIIGRSTREGRDGGMAVAWGELVTTPAYADVRRRITPDELVLLDEAGARD